MKEGGLRRYLFDSNVRAYLGSNLVNKDIAGTLANEEAPNFWWLNNGVTILATEASVVGKKLNLKDIQIVNGLQTTESIYRHFSVAPAAEDDRRTVLLKVIVSREDSVRDQVIRATNNQSLVQPAALHATDRIQRDIEEILIQHEWYYERRTNFFKNEGRPEARIISPLQLAVGSTALLLKNPLASSRLKQKHLRSSEAYEIVYSNSFPIECWPAVATLVRAAENGITKRLIEKPTHGRAQHISTWRGPFAYLLAVKRLGSFGFTHKELASIKEPHLSDSFVSDCLNDLIKSGNGLGMGAIGHHRFTKIMEQIQTIWEIKGQLFEGQRKIPSRPFVEAGKPRKIPIVNEDLILAVKQALPVKQPWKRGIAHEIAAVLNIKVKLVNYAIETLIFRGERMRQIGGTVYDKDGKLVITDSDLTENSKNF